jgi:hypothetical protein
LNVTLPDWGKVLGVASSRCGTKILVYGCHFIRELESHSSLGHYQDMNVLGAGPGDDEPLQPGMVFAIEPVLYSPQQNFAVFLEDVILVTDTGYDVLSEGMPYTVQEVESVMRQTSVIEAVDHRQR